MPWEPTQMMDFEFHQETGNNLGNVYAGHPSGYLIQVSETDSVVDAHIIPRASYTYMIGRSDICDITINNPTVSNHHATFEIENGVLWITDEGSTNRTSIGNRMPTEFSKNKLCQPGRSYQVSSKQFITLGQVHFRYYNYFDYCTFIQTNASMHRNISEEKLTPPKTSVGPVLAAVVEKCEVGGGKRSLVDKNTILSEKNETNNEACAVGDEALEIDGDGCSMRDGHEDSREINFSDENICTKRNFKEVESSLLPTQESVPCTLLQPETNLFDPKYHNSTVAPETQVFDPCYVLPDIKSNEIAIDNRDAFPRGQHCNDVSQTSNIPKMEAKQFPPAAPVLHQYISCTLETQSFDFEPSGCLETQVFDPFLLKENVQQEVNVKNAQGLSLGLPKNTKYQSHQGVEYIAQWRPNEPEKLSHYEDGKVMQKKEEEIVVPMQNCLADEENVKKGIEVTSQRQVKLGTLEMFTKGKGEAKETVHSLEAQQRKSETNSNSCIEKRQIPKEARKMHTFSQRSTEKQRKTAKKSLGDSSKKRNQFLLPASRSSRKRQKVSKASGSVKPVIFLIGPNNMLAKSSLERMGATIMHNIDSKITHLCTDKYRPTENFLCGLAYCDHLVSNKWLERCIELGTFDVDEAKFRIKGDLDLTKIQRSLNFKLSELIVRRNRKRKKIFSGLKLYMTCKVDPTFGRMFTAHGGSVSNCPGTKYNSALIVLGFDISDEEAQKLISRQFKVRRTKWVIAAIFRQRLPPAKEFRIKKKKII